MSDTQTPANPKPKSENVGAEPLENQPLQPEEPATEPIKNTSESEPSESEPPAVEKPQTRLEKLLEERQKLDQRIKQQLEKAAAEKRKQETRQKILIGAAIQKQISKGKLTPDWLLAVLDAELTLEHDRKLFHLPPLPEITAPTKRAG